MVHPTHIKGIYGGNLHRVRGELLIVLHPSVHARVNEILARRYQDHPPIPAVIPARMGLVEGPYTHPTVGGFYHPATGAYCTPLAFSDFTREDHIYVLSALIESRAPVALPIEIVE